MIERLEVQRAIAAEPGAIFQVLTDPHGHVAIDSSGMLMGASGSPVRRSTTRSSCIWTARPSAITRWVSYDVTVRIVRYDENTEVAWTVEGNFNLGHVYGYRLEPIDGGHAGHLLLRLVGSGPGMEGRQHLSGRTRVRAERQHSAFWPVPSLPESPDPAPDTYSVESNETGLVESPVSSYAIDPSGPQVTPLG